MAQLRIKPMWRHVFGERGRFGALLAGFGAVFLAIGVVHHVGTSGALASAARTTGVVAQVVSGDPVIGPHSVGYVYRDIEGRAHERWETLGPRAATQLRAGATVEVAYPRHAAQRGFLVGNVDPALGHVFFAVGLAATLGGAAHLAGRAVGWRKLRRLADVGALVEGRVLAVRSTELRIQRRRQYRLAYEFSPIAGVWRDGLSGFAPLAAIARLEPGSPVHVIVDPQRPEEFALAREVYEAA